MSGGKRSRLGSDPWANIAPGTDPKPERTSIPTPGTSEPAPIPTRATSRRSLAQLAVRVDPVLIDRAKNVARLSGTTLAQLVVDALEAEIARRRDGLREQVEREIGEL